METVETKKGRSNASPDIVILQTDMVIVRQSSTARSLSASKLCG